MYEVTNGDAEVILKKAGEAGAEDGVVLLRGLPYSCTEDDIAHFFSGRLAFHFIIKDKKKKKKESNRHKKIFKKGVFKFKQVDILKYAYFKE